ncbi:TPA: hypothetical protein ACPIAX_004001 [Pseudomonas aeruginosa]|jgi:hypothetical protein|nr:hypothetical protein [Pseudomonas sp. NFPP33]ELZ4498225.1 hypothetical protein [Pseudomonas aeruginosa]SDA76901.1 hypothetical protein SAMN03159475_3972 [Pseudomonas sp. NFPP33]
MFRTYKHAELEFPKVFGSDFQMWHFIELGIHRPWFYAGTLDGEGDDALVTMKMIPNVDVLECLLAEHSDAQITSLQIISPNYVNGTPGWMMEDLVSLVVLGDQTGRTSGYRCAVNGGRSYDVMDLGADPETSHVKKVLFKRT